MAGTDSVESVDWPAAILDSRRRWTLGESLIHSQTVDGRRLDSNIEGFLQNAVIMSARLGGSSSNLQLQL